MENNLNQITQYVAPVASLAEAGSRYEDFQQFVKDQLKKDVDFGTIPGVAKPTLLKPGAEKLATFFGLRPVLVERESVKDWTGKDHDGEPFFYFEYACELYRGVQLVASSIGSCNSMEKKYRYRAVQEEDVPAHLDKERLKKVGGKRTEFAFAIEKAETGGQYGKPQSYWDEWQEAIETGRAKKIHKSTKTGKVLDAYEMDTTAYQIPNPDIPDLVNTIQKMAQKRAIVGSVLIATNASGFFTQDVEDMDIGFTAKAPASEDVVDGEFSPVPNPEPKQTAKKKAAVAPDTSVTYAKPYFPGEDEFLTAFNGTPEDFPIDLETAMGMKDSNGEAYADKSIETLFYMRAAIEKRLVKNHLTDVERDALKDKVAAINVIFANAKLAKGL